MGPKNANFILSPNPALSVHVSGHNQKYFRMISRRRRGHLPSVIRSIVTSTPGAISESESDCNCDSESDDACMEESRDNSTSHRFTEVESSNDAEVRRGFSTSREPFEREH